ncbi:MAG: hypothetical protein WKG07_19260 [Hymenobacter sp.]
MQRNNLVVEQQKAQRLTELSVALLKFQMGLPQQPGRAADRLAERGRGGRRRPAPAPGRGQLRQAAAARPALRPCPASRPLRRAGTTPPSKIASTSKRPLAAAARRRRQAALNYNNRIEFSTLETQQALAGLDLRNRRAGAYPRLLLTGAYGFTGSGQTPGELFDFRGPELAQRQRLSSTRTGSASATWA